MSFAAPALLATLALVPVYVWLRLRQRRPPVAVVSSLLLWRAIPPAPPEVLARRERRWNLVLLLEGLSFALLCAALGRPFLPRDVARPVHLVLAIDDSASLGARDRWQRLTARAEKLLGGLQDDDIVTLLSGDSERPRISPAAARAAVHALAPRPAEDDLDGLLARARATAREDGVIARVLTDRALPGSPEVESFGGPADNAGILEAHVEGSEAFVLVAATSPRRVEIETIGADGKPPGAATPLDVTDRATPVLITFRDDVPARVRLATKDDLAADDEVGLAAEAPPVRVRIETPGNPELVRALSVQPGVELVQGDAGPADLLVLDRSWPTEGPRERSVVVIAPPEGCPYRGEEVSGPIDSWEASQGLLGGLDPQAAAPKKARALGGNRGRVTPLASVQGKPVIALVREGVSTMVYVGFDVSLGGGESAWATHPHFPVFWNRVVRLAAGTAPAARPRSGLCSRRETLCAGQEAPGGPVDFPEARVVSSPRSLAAPALVAAALGLSFAFLLASKANGWRSSSSSTTR